MTGNGNEGGFTLAEILVVVVIVGILAAVAVPVFLNQRAQAQDAAAISIVRNAATAILAYQAQNGVFPSGDTDSVEEMREVQPSVDWRASMDTRVPLDSDAMTGVVPFERSAGGVVFGTRSASGECLYMRIDAAGARYGRDSVCDDPYETSNEGRITDSSWS